MKTTFSSGNTVNYKLPLPVLVPLKLKNNLVTEICKLNKSMQYLRFLQQ